jgi:hypothetical protein
VNDDVEYSSNPLTYLPAAYKRPIYFVYSLVGLILGSIALVSMEGWALTATAVYTLVGTVIGATAGSNVTPAKNKPGR